jgi:uncharacterized protein YxeA
MNKTKKKIMKKLFLIIAIVIIGSFSTKSQVEVGILKINKPLHMDSVMMRLKKLDSQQKLITGYRIMIFNATGSNANEKSLEVKARFLTSFPKMSDKVDQVYEYPRYEVLVGKYKKRTDAFQDLQKIKKVFRNAIIIDSKFEHL